MPTRYRSSGDPCAKVIPRFAGMVPRTDGQSPVAQLAELPTVNRTVPGSSPRGGATRRLASCGPSALIVAMCRRSALITAGCGWSPPSADRPGRSRTACTPAEGPTADTVTHEVTKLPAATAGAVAVKPRAGTPPTAACTGYRSARVTPRPTVRGQVLFFDHNSPIGTPTPDPRPYVTVTSRPGHDTVTVQYQWKQGNDQPCCPTGYRHRAVPGGRRLTLKALDPIPNS